MSPLYVGSSLNQSILHLLYNILVQDMCERSLYEVIFDHVFLFLLYLESNAPFVNVS